MDDDIKEASAIDKTVNKEFPNVSVKESLKVFPPAALT